MAVWAVSSGAVPPNEPLESYFLIFRTEPAVNLYLQLPSAGAGDIRRLVREREQLIATEQDEVMDSIARTGAIVTGRFKKLANAVRVVAHPSALSSLKQLQNVKDVQVVPRHKPSTSTSVPFVGANQIWGKQPYPATGQNVRIGIIDSGIDYFHADFGGSGNPNDFSNNDPKVIEPGSFPTTKVVGGYDFAGDTYNADNNPIPQPDPDPVDCAGNGHGTHVAGIAAGCGVLTNGTSFRGPYSGELKAEQFTIGPGVAPDALLYSLRVFGCGGSTGLLLDALEWATDPDDNGDYSDHLDIINLSLGSPFGLSGPGDVEQSGVNKLSELGAIVAVAAGNSGDVFYIVSAPGTSERAITVANSYDIGMTTGGLKVISPPGVAGIFEAIEGGFTPALSSVGPVQGELVYVDPPLACGDLITNLSLAGKIALIDRGTCYFVDKIKRAQDAGAIAVVMVNNVDGPPIIMGGTPEYTVTIPAMMIRQSDGQLIKSNLSATVVVQLASGVVLTHPEMADRLEASTSRGPALPASLLKPDVAAPGASISSARAGGGSSATDKTGTSMSTPHVAGAAALLRELHPTWQADEIKAALMNTAAGTRNAEGNPYPETLTGAGRIDLAKAGSTPVIARVEGSSGLVSINYGALLLTNTIQYTTNILLRNFGSNAVSFTVSVSNALPQSGFNIVPVSNSVVIAPLETVLFPVRLVVDPSTFTASSFPANALVINGSPRFTLPEVNGKVWFKSDDFALQVAYFACVRMGSSVSPTNTNIEIADFTNQVVTNVALVGRVLNPDPLVAVFQLGAISSRLDSLQQGNGPADLLAVGASSNGRSSASLDSSTVFFGLAVAECWASPLNFSAQFKVEVDNDLDGAADFAVINSSAGNAAAKDLNNSSSASDVFMPVVRALNSGSYLTNYFLGGFPPRSTDVGVFNNGMMVMPVAARDIGVSEGHSVFNYRVISSGPEQRSGGEVDRTDWIRFDAARPVIDSTGYGVSHSPFVALTNEVPIRVDLSAGTANGAADPYIARALLLHYANPAGRQHDVITFTARRPQTIVMQSPVVRDGKVEIRWSSQAGKSYRVLATADLQLGFKEVVADNVTGDPPENSVEDSLSEAGRFYRIEQR